jgi:uncharacterized membrane protein
MLKNLKIYLAFLLVLTTFDMIWLLGIAKNLYSEAMGALMSTEPKLIAGVAFYLFYALGVCKFVVFPATLKQSLSVALKDGALFGFFCYMTYDLTNLAVIQNFPFQLALIDIAWGSFITSMCAGITYWLEKKLIR